jgi:hypothetical protein
MLVARRRDQSLRDAGARPEWVRPGTGGKLLDVLASPRRVSSSRQALWPTMAPRPLGWWTWRCVLEYDRAEPEAQVAMLETNMGPWCRAQRFGEELQPRPKRARRSSCSPAETPPDRHARGLGCRLAARPTRLCGKCGSPRHVGAQVGAWGGASGLRITRRRDLDERARGGIACTEGGELHGRLLRKNDQVCLLVGRAVPPGSATPFATARGCSQVSG